MYEKTDKLCPNCFRWLLRNTAKGEIYCPDTISCRVKGSLSMPPLTVTKAQLRRTLVNEIRKDKNYQNLTVIKRINKLLGLT